MLKKEILRTIKYFSFFHYPPSLLEIYTFFPEKITKKKLKLELEYLVKKKKLVSFEIKVDNSLRYTIGGEGIKNIKNQISKIKDKYQISKKKLNNWRLRLYFHLLSYFPQIKLVGLSGSMAMMNAEENDDIDLFIITAKNRLFTGRFIAVVLAKLLGLYRRRFPPNCQLPINQSQRQVGTVQGFVLRNPVGVETFSVSSGSASPITNYKNKLCLNLFFDEKELAVPEFKKTEYVAHEILQMKPLIIKGDVYQRFLVANNWVFDLFPNAILLNLKFKIQNSKLQSKIKNFKFFIVILRFAFCILNSIANKIEQILRKFQLYLINRHRTLEIITDFQLWFHPEDFGKRIKASN